MCAPIILQGLLGSFAIQLYGLGHGFASGWEGASFDHAIGFCVRERRG